MIDGAVSRRQLLGSMSSIVASSSPQQRHEAARPNSGTAAAPRLAPVEDVVLVCEFEESARLKLPSAVFSTIAGTDHGAFDRITLRPRVLIPTMDLDLSVELFGEKLFAPVLIGPVPDQRRYHPGAEMETVCGAAAASTAVVVSSASSVAFEQLAPAAQTPLWIQVLADADANTRIRRAVRAGARAVVVTLKGAPGAGAAAEPGWDVVGGLCKGLGVPVLVKGVLTPAAAKRALDHGAQGIIVSSWGSTGGNAPIMAVAPIVDAVGAKVPVLVDGSFRLGTDILKALAFGARAVLISRPAMWALAGYGAAGVQAALGLLHAELGRAMAMMGSSTPKSLTRTALKLHAR